MMRARPVVSSRLCVVATLGIAGAFVACGGRTLDDGSHGAGNESGGAPAASSGGRSGTTATGGRANGGRGAGGKRPDTGAGGDTTAPVSDRQSQYSTDYGKRCLIDSDCVLVVEGDQCRCRPCDPFAAIAKVSLGEWQNDLNRIRCSDGRGACPRFPCAREPAVHCDNQVCRIRTPAAADAGTAQPTIDASPGTGGRPIVDASPEDGSTYGDI